MLPNTESLLKILELESRKGYTDTAVIGGLDKFLHNWSASAAETITKPRLLARFKKLTKPDYASLTKEQRQDWTKNVLDFLIDLEKGGGEKEKTLASKPPPRPSAIKRPVKKPEPVKSLDSSVTIVKGISDNLAARFAKLGVRTVRDLLYFSPNRHLDYSQRKTISQLTEGKEETIVANVWEAREIRLGPRRSTEATVGDETGNVRVVWFNNPYLAKRLTTNSRIILSGRVGVFKGRHVFESPEWEFFEDQELTHAGRLVPLYPLTQGLYPRQVRKIMKEAVDRFVWELGDFLPKSLKERQKLLDLPQAISQAHFPENEEARMRSRIRLAFDELFILQLGVMSKKRSWQESQPGNPLNIDQPVLTKFIKSLPFALTQAQEKVLRELLSDLEKPRAMSRLLQGDVGSGKTVVATAGLLMAAANGYQGAFMAPTEILAEQHFATISQLLSRAGQLEQEEDYMRTYSGILPHPLTLALLTGDMKQSKKQGLQKCLEEGKIDIAIGTHALIQEDVVFPKLGLAVVDEQHRFGVTQRSALRQKGFNPHVLVMTATPIPRTLALTVYGDLDLSVLDQLPPGRQIIKTKWLRPDQRESAYAFIRKQVAEGRQAFILCPLVEESEAIQAKAAVAEYERLSQEVFPDLKLGLLHGRMSATDKDAVMRQFRACEMHILVATPVIEVGIDIPNATVMMVESADRFGLSQLHQFRGRVGRGKDQSYCMLLAEHPSEIGQERLDIIEKVHDGFKLAEEDLRLRGPGEFFGTRQSGLPDLRMAKLSDVAILELARAEAIRLFQEDPGLKLPEHSPLVKELARVWPEAAEWS